MTAKLKQRRWLKDRAKMVCCSTMEKGGFKLCMII